MEFYIVFGLYISLSLLLGLYVHKKYKKWREKHEISIEQGYMLSFASMLPIVLLMIVLIKFL